ncbi:Bile acid:sodium symporter [Thermogutta terrifontis]|uniref:Bile acid:sodium symporter n=1 Tax=Thermogutta terrifontis TaxID=1331910 RepID=A0A286RA70_9BACT|nr:bile acid:sodium symporter family protein [Thermogutta terrifontis]ASV72858.1 Bile acid:sodium symporter [Thermogutta terrifontis]
MLRHYLERFLPVWLVLLCLVAFVWSKQSAQQPDPFLLSRPYLPHLIALTMLAIGSLLAREELLGVFQRWPLVFFGTAVQYSSMPALAYLSSQVWGLKGPWLIGCLMVGCVPGAMASNVLTLIARGNVSYSVSLTTSATLLSPLVVPFVMWLTVGRFAKFPVVRTGVELLFMVVLPVAVGFALSQFSTLWRKTAEKIGPIIANLVILWIIAVVVAANRTQLYAVNGILVAALGMINFGGYAAGYLAAIAARLPVGMRRALTLEIGMQNAGLGTTLALSLFPDQPQAAIPCALYTFGCMFTGTLLSRWMASFPIPPSSAGKQRSSRTANSTSQMDCQSEAS